MNKIVRLSLLLPVAISLGLGFSTGANALPGVKPKGATLQDLAGGSSTDGSPEIAAAEQRVEQAKAQVELAKKQVSASQALLRAAQADFKAATSEVQALKLSAQAQGLVEQTGMTPAKANPVSIASKAADTNKDKGAPAPTTTPTTTMPPTAPAPTGGESNPVSTDSAAEPIQLR